MDSTTVTTAPEQPKWPIETRLFINGEFVHATSGQTIKLINPATQKLAAEVEIASKEDVDRAVDAAKAAQPAWAALTGKERGRYLRKLAEKITENVDELGELETISMGKPTFMTHLETGWGTEYLETLAGLAESIYGESSLNQNGYMNISIKQPYGVVAGIIPWNLGSPMWIWKVGPAVAAGNTIILKASEKSPLMSIGLAKMVALAGFPPGVINIVNGAGETGSFLSSHPEIRKISFTGSTMSGRRVQAAAAASNLKVVTLELGGKSPSVVFDDADVASAAEAVANSLLINMGQVCTSNSRVYVQESLAPTLLEHVKGHFAAWASRQGDPQNVNNLLGPLADEAQLNHVSKYLDIGIQEAKVAIGGEKEGGYVKPTVFTDVSDDSRINTEEIFGPVLVYHTFKTEEEAIERANATEYGLYSSVFTKDIDRAIRVAKALETGMVGVNAASPTLHYDMPFGGWKASGYGIEMGRGWIENWMRTKSLYIKIADVAKASST